MSEESSFSREANKLREKISKNKSRKDKVDSVLTWMVNIAGLVLGVVGVAWNNSIEKWLLLVLILIDVIVVLLLGKQSVITRSRIENEADLRELTAAGDVDAANRRADQLAANLKAEQDAHSSEVSMWAESQLAITSQFEAVLRVESEAASNLSRIYIEYFTEANRLLTYRASLGDNPPRKDHDFIQQSVMRNLDRVRRDFIVYHRSFVGNVVEAAKASVEQHLRARGIELPVSVAVKLFAFPGVTEDLVANSMQPNIFTGYRDSVSYQSLRRQRYPLPLYTLAGNSDFDFAIRKRKPFIFNNETRHGHVENESGSFPVHYNCGATASICAAGSDYQKDWWCYGFLACDVNNPKDNSDVNPMDDEVGVIISCYANILGEYYDNLYDIWCNMFYTDPLEGLDAEEAGENTNAATNDDVPFWNVDTDDKRTSFFYYYYQHLNRRNAPSGASLAD